VSWVQDTADLRNNPPLDPWYNAAVMVVNKSDPTGNYVLGVVNETPERMTTVSYSDSILADNGYSELNSISSLDTGNKNAANQNNLKSQKQFDFATLEDAYGRATTAESLLVDTVSMGSKASERFNCPFAAPAGDAIPPYCNVVEMGSTFSGSGVSMVTTASERTVSKSADIPVEMGYSIGLTGQGSASASIRAHIMEGRYSDTVTQGYVYDGTVLGAIAYESYPEFDQSVDLSYTDKTTASGQIETFSKAFTYQSGVRRI